MPDVWSVVFGGSEGGGAGGGEVEFDWKRLDIL